LRRIFNPFAILGRNEVHPQDSTDRSWTSIWWEVLEWS